MEESVAPYTSKPLSKSQNQLLQKILAFKCKEVSAVSKKDGPCSEATHSLVPETEQVMVGNGGCFHGVGCIYWQVHKGYAEAVTYDASSDLSAESPVDWIGRLH